MKYNNNRNTVISIGSIFSFNLGEHGGRTRMFTSISYGYKGQAFIFDRYTYWKNA